MIRKKISGKQFIIILAAAVVLVAVFIIYCSPEDIAVDTTTFTSDNGESVEVSIDVKIYNELFRPESAIGEIVFDGIKYVDYDSFKNNSIADNLNYKKEGTIQHIFVREEALTKPDTLLKDYLTIESYEDGAVTLFKVDDVRSDFFYLS